jgi:hypothetical protein
MLPRCKYWAVACRPCGSMIALAVVRYDEHGKIIDPPAVADEIAFNATCVVCRTSLPYASHQVTHYEASLPTPTFIEHPSFVPLLK